jgi:hypothetical protein
MVRLPLALLCLFASEASVLAEDVVAPPISSAEAQSSAGTPTTVCNLIETVAAEQGIPVEFLTRLIWKESTFRPEALSSKGAQGIAQFMPGTAVLRQLADPFDPKKAIPASALYLKDLSARFGNLGLAAAAYDAGEQRVSDWLVGKRGLPWETRDYVLTITGRSAEDWAQPDADPVSGGTPPTKASTPANCIETAALLGRPGVGSAVVADLPQAGWAPWGVQVAGNFSLNRAMASYSLQQRRYPAILGAGPPLVVRRVNGGQGRAPFFQIRLPAPTRKTASDLCRRLEAAGGACVVLRNGS